MRRQPPRRQPPRPKKSSGRVYLNPRASGAYCHESCQRNLAVKAKRCAQAAPKEDSNTAKKKAAYEDALKFQPCLWIHWRQSLVQHWRNIWTFSTLLNTQRKNWRGEQQISLVQGYSFGLRTLKQFFYKHLQYAVAFLLLLFCFLFVRRPCVKCEPQLQWLQLTVNFILYLHASAQKGYESEHKRDMNCTLPPTPTPPPPPSFSSVPSVCLPACKSTLRQRVEEKHA